MKFIRWIGCLWLILVVLMCAVVWRGRDTANRLSAFDLDICDGKPCYRGIVPGVTLWDDVRTHLDSTMISVDEYRTIAVTLTDKIEIVIYRDAGDQPVVGTIRISDFSIVDMMPTDFPSLGHFLLTYGLPCLVIVDTSSPTRVHVTQLTYPTLAINLYSTEPFSPAARVKDAWIFNSVPDLCTVEFNKSIGLSWAGFASVTSYLDTMRERSKEHFGP